MKAGKLLLAAAGSLVAAGTLGFSSVAAAPTARLGPAAIAPGVDGARAAGSVEYSRNWSGYVSTVTSLKTPRPFTSVQAEWTERAYGCNGESPEAAVVWVGLDGWNGNTVEQGGTYEACDGTAQGTHYAWWEMYPTNSITEVFAVNVGDRMYASVTYGPPGHPGAFKIVVTDKTSRRGFTEFEKCQDVAGCPRSSAEWIVERPSYGGAYSALPQWAPFMGFTDGMARVQTRHAGESAVARFPSFAVDMVNDADTEDMATAATPGVRRPALTDVWQSYGP